MARKSGRRGVARNRKRVLLDCSAVSKRSQHTFEFTAPTIAAAAKDEAEWHEGRLLHWQELRDQAVEIVKQTIGAKVIEREQTNGTYVDVVVDYGDPAAWQEYQKASQKIKDHRAAAERYRSDQRVYETQASRTYELDLEDVHHFRLGGEPREE